MKSSEGFVREWTDQSEGAGNAAGDERLLERDERDPECDPDLKRGEAGDLDAEREHDLGPDFKRDPDLDREREAERESEPIKLNNPSKLVDGLRQCNMI